MDREGGVDGLLIIFDQGLMVVAVGWVGKDCSSLFQGREIL